MAIETVLGLFDLGIVVALCTALYRGRKGKILKLTMINDPVTTVRSIVISGRGLTFITISWGIIIILLILSAGMSFSGAKTVEDSYIAIITVASIFLILITATIASRLSSN